MAETSAVLKAVSRFKKILESKRIRMARLVLFGSHASGDGREGSDIDVVVISSDFRGKSYWERIEILSDAIYEVLEPIEAIALTPDEWRKKKSVMVNYAKKGKVIFAGGH